MSRTTIFRKLLIQVIIPVILALVVLAAINYQNNKEKVIASNNEINSLVTDEIKNILLFQDEMLEMIEADLDARVRHLSNMLESELRDTRGIKAVNLSGIQSRLGMDPQREDIYIINRSGVIINTTFEKDLGFNLFAAIGGDFKRFLLDVMDNGEFVPSRFSVEDQTGKLRKYSYQPTQDKNYIIELGVYSKEAEEKLDMVRDLLSSIADKHEGIVSVDLFFGEKNPFSFNPGVKIAPEHKGLYSTAFSNRSEQSVIERVDGQKLHTSYIYMERENTDIYKGSVLRIVSDRSNEDALVRQELMMVLKVFGVAIVLILILTLWVARSITSPIKNLVTSIDRISEGNLSERTTPQGSKEIVTLSVRFNQMLEILEGFYRDLEEKVRERTAEIAKQKEVLEEQKQRIEDSILYARRIQHAILPDESALDAMLPEYFVLYRPKDIVSGDFYWALEKNGKAVIAACDCTGHGVPGAFMSMIGNTSLNRIVGERGVTDPEKILFEARRQIIHSLRQTGADGETKDGMDAAILTVDKAKGVVQYSGANNPLVIVRDGEVEQIKADKQPVGYFMGTEAPFTGHKVEVKKGDTLFIYTDGYQDQFGGPQERKFMAGRFKKLLGTIGERPAAAQKAALDVALDEWMEGQEQLDDILVIGIKF